MLLDEAPLVGHSRVSELLLKMTLLPVFFPLGWSNKSLPVDLRLYNEFDFILTYKFNTGDCPTVRKSG